MKAITPSLPSPAPTRSERSVDSAAADEAFGAVIAAALGVAPAPGPQYRAPQDSADKDRHYAATVGPARHTAAGAGLDRADGDRPVGSDGAATGAGGATAAVTAPDDSARPGAATTTAADANPKAGSTAGVSAAATPAAAPTAGGAPATPATAGTAPRTGAAPGSALNAAAAALAKALGASGTGVNVNGTPGTATVTSPATGTVDARAVAQQPALTTVANSAVAQGVLPPQLVGVAADANPLPTAEGGTKKTPVPTVVSRAAATAASAGAARPTASPATSPIAPGKPPAAPVSLPATAGATAAATAGATAAPLAATVVAAPAPDTAKGSKSGSSKGDGLDAGVAGNTGATPDASLAPGAVTSFDAAMQTAVPLIPPTAAATEQNMSAAFVAGNVPDQIVQVLAPLRSAKDGDYTLSLQLHPAELGPVTVHVEVHQGVLSVHLVADQAQGHDALHGSLADLRTQLQASGVRTGDIGVGTSGSALSQQGSGGHLRQQPHSGQPGYDGTGRRPGHHDRGSTFGGRGGDRSGDRNAATQRQPVGVSADSALDVRI